MKHMKRIVTFGELMLRLTPPGYGRFLQATAFDATWGGAEANVAVSLATMGMEASFVSKLPDNEIGQAALNSLRRFGVDTKDIVRGGERLGLYYMEKGASQRPSKVIYDRAHSAIAEASAADFDWDAIFTGADWFHFTGITPALSPALADICKSACEEAKRRGLTVSCDFNYRSKLWSLEKAKETMETLTPYMDLAVNAQDVLFPEMDLRDMEVAAPVIAGRLLREYGIRQCAITLRRSHSANDNDLSGVYGVDGVLYRARTYPVHIVDRVGGGDSFTAALIYACLSGFDPEKSVEFAVAADCLKHSIEGDANLVTAPEALALSESGGNARIQR